MRSCHIAVRDRTMARRRRAPAAFLSAAVLGLGATLVWAFGAVSLGPAAFATGSAAPEVGFSQRRAALLGGGLVATLVAAEMPMPARAETTEAFDKILRRFAPQVQSMADRLVFDVRTWIDEREWKQIAALYKGEGDSVIMSQFYNPVNQIFNGGEIFLDEVMPGSAKAIVQLDKALREFGQLATGGPSGSPKTYEEDEFYKAWDEVARTVNQVMRTCNKLIETEPTLKDMKLFEYAVADKSKYPRDEQAYIKMKKIAVMGDPDEKAGNAAAIALLVAPVFLR